MLYVPNALASRQLGPLGLRLCFLYTQYSQTTASKTYELLKTLITMLMVIDNTFDTYIASYQFSNKTH